MPDNGVILVVTNAGSHELKLVESIKEKSLKKNVKIYFAFSPFCYESCEESLPVYKHLSDGRMFNNTDFSRESFFKTVVYTVRNYSKKVKTRVDCSLVLFAKDLWKKKQGKRSLHKPTKHGIAQ